ncbi:MAG TPA: pyridoxamine 5'-phosphate oxidase [Polyangiaceae bacterium]|jgi:pyridoxamine 5'-phosphate oxidase
MSEDDPVQLFLDWYVEAVRQKDPLPEAMTLATATPQGAPSARLVLFKGITGGRITFFTNYDSRKARELEANPRAALVFYWTSLHRQVRIEGTVERVESAQSNAYFSTRPRTSQLSAWASPQSREVSSREELDRAYREVEQRFSGRDVERPPNWGGYGLKPERFEFWIGREHRLHDRYLYLRSGEQWTRTMLAP